METRKYSFYVFDLDGTIANLSVDWKDLKRRISDTFYNGDAHALRLSDMIQGILANGGQQRQSLIDMIRDYEQPGGTVHFVSVEHVDSFLRGLQHFYVVSNNLSSTVEQVLEQMSLRKKCRFIVGLNDVDRVKPSAGPFVTLMEATGNKDRSSYLYIGNSDVDEIFARNVGIDFKLASEII